jgi:D-methionine transport system ATP-binding protein
LCDEATSALDPITTRSILELIREINQKMGVTVVIITHEMRVVEQICDRVAVMNQGVIEEEGKVRDVFLNPQSETSRRLILPDKEEVNAIDGRRILRIAFDGQSAFEPIIAQLTIHSNVLVNILGANTENIGGRAYGQMLLELPQEEEAVKKIEEFLKEKGIYFEEGGKSNGSGAD